MAQQRSPKFGGMERVPEKQEGRLMAPGARPLMGA